MSFIEWLLMHTVIFMITNCHDKKKKKKKMHGLITIPNPFSFFIFNSLSFPFYLFFSVCWSSREIFEMKKKSHLIFNILLFTFTRRTPQNNIICGLFSSFFLLSSSFLFLLLFFLLSFLLHRTSPPSHYPSW